MHKLQFIDHVLYNIVETQLSSKYSNQAISHRDSNPVLSYLTELLDLQSMSLVLINLIQYGIFDMYMSVCMSVCMSRAETHRICHKNIEKIGIIIKKNKIIVIIMRKKKNIEK